MKAPSSGGLPTLQRSSISSNPRNDPSVSNRRNPKSRARALSHERTSAAAIGLQLIALASLIALLLGCSTIPFFISNHHLAVGPGSPWAQSWRIPAAVAAVCAALIGLCGWLWTCLFRSRFVDAKSKQRVLGLIFMLPAISGMMIASTLAGTELAREGVGTTIAAAGAIASCLLFATVIGRTASTFVALSLCAVLAIFGIGAQWAVWAVGIASFSGQYAARAVRNRSSIIRATAITTLAAGLTGVVIGAAESHDIGGACLIGMQALLTGCLGAATWFTLLTIMERPYELTTPLGLLELLDPTRPILERFAREAPGTFAHSVMVGHLAATAADAIGADPLLCRVAALYHDIGKLCRAQFFKENQPANENVHDRLNPSLSAIVVNSHVKDGERMAKELGLPGAIRDIIAQHHGTTLMRYFYYRASAGAHPRLDDPLQYQFRYSGPKPQTKEAAIMMLADSIEAASRTLSNPTPESVDGLIAGIISDRVTDRQLDECPITIRDLAIIRKTLGDVLCAMMHQRIEYPGMNRIEGSDVLTEPVAQRYRSEQEQIAIPSAPYDFYEDFDPTILSKIQNELYEEQAKHSGGRGADPGRPVIRPALLSASRREALQRRHAGGIKRPHHK